MADFKQTVLPRWKGFNLLGGFLMSSPGRFDEDEFRIVHDLGFDFIRLPLNYTFWIENDDPFHVNEDKLAFVDEAIRFGERYKLHIQLNFHRAPGFSVAGDRTEPFSLWSDEPAQAAFRQHWLCLAKRYQHITSDQLSFNLINEPHNIDEKTHNDVLLETIGSIREIDPGRLIILDGLDWGTSPNPGLLNLKTEGKTQLAQSCRSYAPHPFTHYKAEWADPDPKQVEPRWPYVNQYDAGDKWDDQRIRDEFAKWAKFADENKVGVHCGEGGAYVHTPHKDVLHWFEACLSALKDFNIGFALWNLSGPFGILDSGRKDASYIDYHGHKLDQEMLRIFRKY